MGKRHVLYAIALLLTLGSCTKEVQQGTESGKQQFVRFTSVVEGTYTRAAGASWSPSDAIGVYMKKNGSDLSTGSIVGEGDNVEYFTEMVMVTFCLYQPIFLFQMMVLRLTL